MALFAFFFALGFLYFPSLLHCSDQGNKNSHSKPFCPDFQCRNFGFFGFPFYNSDPRCGLCRLDCNQTVSRIKLSNVDQRWYNLTGRMQKDFTGRVQNTTIVIRDNVFTDQIYNRSCDAFNNLTFPKTPSISYSFFPPITIFRCSKSLKATLLTDKHFNSSLYHRYRDCRDFNLYYKYPANYEDLSDRVDLPQECLVIQLPHLPQGMLPPGANQSDLFQILAVDIPLDLGISDDCLRCHYNEGQCQNEGRQVLCIFASKAETRNKKVIIATVALAVGVVVLVITGYTISKSTSAKYMVLSWMKAEKYQNIENFLKNYGSLAPKRYSYSDVKKMTNSFKSKLGQGGYGQVYKGKLHNGNPVAVKILNGSKGNGEDFINEVATISRTSHVNIVSFLGFCFEGNKRALVYEFMPNGSLEKFIYDGNSLKDRQLGWEKLYQIAIGIARGLEYLHRGCNTQILHFDIKPHNILLDEDFCPKIADFGLAKLCPGREGILSTMTSRGTIGYIAPEVFCRNFGGVSYKSDVYSYGMMVSEMVGGRKNSEVNPGINTSEIYFPHLIYKQIETGSQLGLHGIMHDGENEIARKMIIVSLWCIQNDPLIRPSMTRVVEMLEGSLELLQIPPKPYLSSPSRLPAHSSTIGLLC